jgi:hypothetical protein
MIPNLSGYVWLYFKADHPLQKLRYFTMPGLCAVWQSQSCHKSFAYQEFCLLLEFVYVVFVLADA